MKNRKPVNARKSFTVSKTFTITLSQTVDAFDSATAERLVSKRLNMKKVPFQTKSKQKNILVVSEAARA